MRKASRVGGLVFCSSNLLAVLGRTVHIERLRHVSRPVEHRSHSHFLTDTKAVVTVGVRVEADLIIAVVGLVLNGHDAMRHIEVRNASGKGKGVAWSGY